MPTFKLSDNLGFSIDIKAGPGVLSRYFKSLPDWAALAINLKQFKDTTWDDSSVVSAQTLLSFSQPIDVGATTVALKIEAGANGTLSIFVPQTDNDPLFHPDAYGDNVPVRLDERYVCASLLASVAPGGSVPVDKLRFGFSEKSAVTLTYCQRFCLNPVMPPVLDSIRQTLSGFAIPGDAGDLAAMPEGSVAAVNSTGTLKFSGTVNLLTSVNPLASVSMPIGSDPKVTSGGNISVGAAYEFTGGYQVRVRRLSQSVFHLGFYRQRQQDFSINAKCSVGITTSLDQNPLFQALLETISAQPQIDQTELAAAGLRQATINGIQSALASAIDRNLALGMTMELHDEREHDAMFLYEVNLDRLDTEGEALLQTVLRGDLTVLAARGEMPAAGIRVLKTLFTSGKTLKHVFKVNLLGIYNRISISSLLRSGTVAWDATTGEYVLTDSANASRIGISSINFGADSEKLRHVLAESLLITAAYRAGACVSGPPEMGASHLYFAMSPHADAGLLWHDLSIGDGLGFTDAAAAKHGLPPHGTSLGRRTVLAETTYNDDAFLALFFSDGRTRTAAEYDRAGRNALLFLTRPEEADGFRVRVAKDDALWAKMRDIGNVASAQFRQLFPDLPSAAVSVVGVDYLNIVWWTDAMRKTGTHIHAIRQYLGVPGNRRTDAKFLKLKEDLSKELADLARCTRQDFGGPWGLLAMSLVASQSGRRFLLFNPAVTLLCEAPSPVLATVS